MRLRSLGSFLVLVALSLGACTEGGEDRSEADTDRRTPRVEVGEPYAYSEPAPPEEPTPLDGSFSRTISIRKAGGPPIFCQRCAPWRLDAGAATLRFDRGKFVGTFEPVRVTIDCRSKTLERECRHPPGFNVSGHFRVQGDQVEIFNDANCIGMTGVYEWSLEDGTIAFEEVEDACPFVRLRAKYLTAAPWHLSS